jgi:opacity protein-like surface antigen
LLTYRLESGVVVGPSFKKLLFLSTISVASGTVFLAQSGSTAGAAGPAYSWNGCYAGVEAGASTSSSRWNYANSNFYSSTGNTDPQLISGVNFNDTRGIIGAQAGCNRALGDWLVGGIEGMWFSNPMNEHSQLPGFEPMPLASNKTVVSTNIQSIVSLTGRLGVAPSSDWLLYGKGGYAAARIDTKGTVTPDFFPTPIADFITTNWHSGWTAGAGIEYRLFRNVTIGLEYDYYKFDSVTHMGTISALDFDANGNPRPASPVLHNVSATTQTLMGRINFAFDTPAVGSGPSAAYAAYVKAPPLAQPAASYSGFVTSEIKGSSWDGTRGPNVFATDPGKGYQVYSPTTIGIDYLMPSQYKLETRVKSGYVYSASTTAGQEARYEGPVDTQASFNLTLLNYDSIRPLFGLNLNLPTGNSYLPNGQRFARMDPDLVDVGSYGVGFNVNPTAGFIVGIDEHTAVSLSAGWTWQDSFTKDGLDFSPIPTANPNVTNQQTITDLKQRVSPGNTYTLNGNVASTFGNLSLNSSFAYMGDSHASIDGIDTGRAGAKFIANGAANYKFDDRTALATNISWSFSEKNDITDANSALVGEPKNSNSNLVIASIEPSYLLTERLKLAANYSYLFRDHNYYDPFQDQFIPSKQKHSVGASTTYVLTNTTILTLRGAHAWVRQGDGPFVPAAELVPTFEPPSLKYQVWTASMAASVSF